MSLDKKTIQHIATLSRLSITDEESESYRHDLSNILNLVEQMNAIDTTGIEPMAHPLELTARLRDDAITESDQRDHFQKIAPQVDEGHYLVPKVIE
ncbi:MAG: Asp-tRNA(Asn)/Glu-tRNA(Gln) amidotransferase subunit GatC [Thiotrichales bacterium]|nr:Asp-tRNA(Asn)/Glu-tRNA(Gln) amidotransferase subunit GatC [Thiotrichales bacterium]